MPAREVQFEHGMTMRELRDFVRKVEEQELDLGVTVMFYPEGESFGLPGRVDAVYPFPEFTTDPQPTPVSFTIRAVEEQSTAETVETLRIFQEFMDFREGGES